MSGTDIVRTKSSLFQKGHAKMGGRKKGTRNRFGGDLREAVVAGIQVVGFMEKAALSLGLMRCERERDRELLISRLR